MDDADLIATAHERSACHIHESHVLGNFFPSLELCWFDVAVDLHMSFGWSHILAKRNDIDVNFPQFPKGVHDLVLRFTNTEHDASFRDSHALFLGMLQDL